ATHSFRVLVQENGDIVVNPGSITVDQDVELKEGNLPWRPRLLGSRAEYRDNPKGVFGYRFRWEYVEAYRTGKPKMPDLHVLDLARKKVDSTSETLTLRFAPYSPQGKTSRMSTVLYYKSEEVVDEGGMGRGYTHSKVKIASFMDTCFRWFAYFFGSKKSV